MTRDRFLPYSKQIIDEEDIRQVVKVLQDPFITQGPLQADFEKKLSDYCEAAFAVLFPNASIALQMAAFASGLGKGDVAITSPNTFVASANAALYTGAEVRFADIDKDTFNISLESIKANLDDRVKAVIPVDFAGEPVDHKSLRKLLGDEVVIIADSCHALGGEYLDSDGQWNKVGDCRYADMAVFSFHPAKNMTTAEGGVVVTNSEAFYQKLRLLQNNGITKDPEAWLNNDNAATTYPGGGKRRNPWYYEMQMLGQNCRLTEIQCALGLSQLKKLDGFVQSRQRLASYYRDSFADSPFGLQKISSESRSGCHIFVLQIDFEAIGTSRVEVMEKLRAAEIGTQVHYIPVHYQPYYASLGHKKGSLPNCESYYQKALSIPLFPDLQTNEADHVIDTLRSLIR